MNNCKASGSREAGLRGGGEGRQGLSAEHLPGSSPAWGPPSSPGWFTVATYKSAQRLAGGGTSAPPLLGMDNTLVVGTDRLLGLGASGEPGDADGVVYPVAVRCCTWKYDPLMGTRLFYCQKNPHAGCAFSSLVSGSHCSLEFCSSDYRQ